MQIVWLARTNTHRHVYRNCLCVGRQRSSLCRGYLLLLALLLLLLPLRERATHQPTHTHTGQKSTAKLRISIPFWKFQNPQSVWEGFTKHRESHRRDRDRESAAQCWFMRPTRRRRPIEGENSKRRLLLLLCSPRDLTLWYDATPAPSPSPSTGSPLCLCVSLSTACVWFCVSVCVCMMSWSVGSLNSKQDHKVAGLLAALLGLCARQAEAATATEAAGSEQHLRHPHNNKTECSKLIIKIISDTRRRVCNCNPFRLN